MPLSPKLYFAFAVAWIVLGAFEYGLNIAILNSVQDPMSCKHNSQSLTTTAWSFLPPCIVMSDTMFGFLTSVYTLGGLLGSLVASRLADTSGRKTSVMYASLMIGIGSILMAFSPNYLLLVIGRIVIGVGCGLETVLVPLYLSEISPPQVKGNVGVMNQLGIVSGIFAGQACAIPFAQPSSWRGIFVVSLGIAGIQCFLTPQMMESPVWIKKLNHSNGTREVEPQRTNETSSSTSVDPESQGLLARNLEDEEPPTSATSSQDSHNNNTQQRTSLSLFNLFQESKRDPHLLKGLKVVLISQCAQQFSGINAVLYYSTTIMKSVFPTSAIYISLFITFVNVLMTFPPLILIERVGRKPLLILSITCMCLMSLTLAISINQSLGYLSSIAIVCFVASFSFGLGPIPFVILGEVVPNYASSSVTSLGLGVNWCSNFIVGLTFLPIRDALSNHGGGKGNVFFIFTVISATSATLLIKYYKP